MAGIEKIKIPVRKNELTIQAIEPYLPTVFEKFCENQKKIQHFWEIYENKHEIYNKTRRYEDDSDINNKVSTPHLWAIVNFKSGYALGNPKEYAQTEEKQTDDIKYLNKYSKSANMRTIDKNVANWVYATGVGYYFTEPKSEIYDSETEAPYDLWLRPADTCAKIYSSYNGEEELFDMLVTSYKKINQGKEKEYILISIYLPDVYYEFECDNTIPNTPKFGIRADKTRTRPIYKKLPLTEKFANESRIGVVEIGETLQNAIDNIYSNEVDNVQDLVNEMLIFRNCVLGSTPEEKAKNLRDAKRGGALEIKDPNPDIEADVKTLSTKLDHTDILSLMESIKNELYATCGVPIAISDTSNGGNKQGALQLGNGWENAYDRLLDEINSFLVADYKLLDKILTICKKDPNSKLNELNASEIEIKYNPNMTDNMVSKSQAYQTFIQCGVPSDLAIAWCRLSNDPVTASRRIEQYREKLAQEQQVINKNVDNSGGNVDNSTNNGNSNA
jgi:SPP1 family phage portal protein